LSVILFPGRWIR